MACLWDYLCTTNAEFRTIRLSESKGKTLLCDFYGVSEWLIDSLYSARAKSGEYHKYTDIYGGDLNHIRQRVLSFVEALRFHDIEPIFFADGPPIPRLKIKAIYDCRSELKSVETCGEICKYDPKTEGQYKRLLKKTHMFEEILHGLVDVNVKIGTSRSYAHKLMASYARRHNDSVCGVLTHHNDVILMTECPMIHYKHFDCNDALNISSCKMETQPSEIKCKVLTPQIVARHFRIDKRCLPALSILCGNHFTFPHSGIDDLLGKPLPKTASIFIRQHELECKSPESFLAIKEIQPICEKDPDYRKAIEASYNYYDFTPEEADEEQKFCKPTEFNCFNISLMEGCMVWRNVVEQLDGEFPCIHDTTQPVRELMYRLLEMTEVREYGQGWDRFTVTSVVMTPFESVVLSNLRKQTYIEKMYFICSALCEQKVPVSTDCAFPPSFHCSMSAALICSSVIYARKHQLIPDEYITPLLLACFSCVLGKMPPLLKSRPGPTGVTIAAQFMVVLKHARLLASLVGISWMEHPLPSEVFQPFVYIPLHDTAFKISQKLKFRGESAEASKEYYDSLSKKRAFMDFRACICSMSGSIDCHQFVQITQKFTEACRKLETCETSKASGLSSTTAASKSKKSKK